MWSYRNCITVHVLFLSYLVNFNVKHLRFQWLLSLKCITQCQCSINWHCLTLLRCEFHVTNLFLFFLAYYTLFLFNYFSFKFKINRTKIFSFSMNLQQPHMSYVSETKIKLSIVLLQTYLLGLSLEFLGLRTWSYIKYLRSYVIYTISFK